MTPTGRIAPSTSHIEGSTTTSRRRHSCDWCSSAAFLLTLFYLVAVVRVIDIEAVRRAVAATGPARRSHYVVVSAALGSIFVPGRSSLPAAVCCSGPCSALS